jgi:hypothetical protein
MKLEYKILWVEDEEDYLESFPIDRIKDHIRSNGFEPFLTFRSRPDEIRLPVNKNDFDLLVVDFNITEDQYHGSDLIQEIRSNKCLTEVVFYSGGDIDLLYAASGEKKLEGIYFGPKDATSLARKITDVFDLTVRKVLDVNNMRGFVMAGVAELDLLLEEIITVKYDKLLPGDQIVLRRKMVEKILPESKYLAVLAHELPDEKKQLLTTALAGIKEHQPATFEVLFGRRMDSSKRVETVIGFCKTNQYLNAYKEDISQLAPLLHWRNALAHQRPVEGESGALQFEVQGLGVKLFDDVQTLELRKQIRLYIERLTSVLDAVKEFQLVNT